MTVEYIRYRIPGDRSDAFAAAYARAAAALERTPQCVDYELSRCEEEPVCHTLRITWTSTRDHL